MLASFSLSLSLSLSAVNDFSPQSGAVVFSPGEVRKDFLVSLTQDTMCDDGIESFSLFLESGGSSVAVGQPASTTVFIVDDDGMMLTSLNIFPYSDLYCVPCFMRECFGHVTCM